LDEDNTIKEKLLIIRELQTTSKGTDLMKIISDYFQTHDTYSVGKVSWLLYGRSSRYARITLRPSNIGESKKLQNSNNTLYDSPPSTCIKNVAEELANTMKLAITLVNAVKNSGR
jgi:hypothetical protein